MGRKVYITSDMSTDERLISVAQKSPEAALLWPWLVTAFDDWGRMEASPLQLKARTFPMISSVTVDLIDKSLNLYAEAGIVLLYEVQSRRYCAVTPDKWFKHQTHIRREKRVLDGSRYPPPPSSDSAQVREDARGCAQQCEVDMQTHTFLPSSLPPFLPSPSTKEGTTPTPPQRTREEEKELRAPIDFWQHNIGPNNVMKPHELDILLGYLRKGLNGDCLKHGMELAVENASPNMRYISAIYDRWIAAESFTIETIRADEKNRRQRKARDSPDEGGVIVTVPIRTKGGPTA